MEQATFEWVRERFAEVLELDPSEITTASRFADLGFQIIWDGVDGGKPYDPSTPPSESFKVEDPDGIVVDVTASPDQWPGVSTNRFAPTYA